MHQGFTKKGVVYIILAVVLLIAMVYLGKKDKNKNGEVCFENKCFYVSLAINPEDKKKGLMYKESIKEDEGMLFIYDKENIYKFWMKNVKFPLDIVWINGNKEVVFINKNSLPCLNDPCPSIYPGAKAKYVLEINGGLCEKIGLGIGNKLDIIIPE